MPWSGDWGEHQVALLSGLVSSNALIFLFVCQGGAPVLSTEGHIANREDQHRLTMNHQLQENECTSESPWRINTRVNNQAESMLERREERLTPTQA